MEFLNKVYPLKECPICKKNFIPAPEHYWKIDVDGSRPRLVCSYTCMRAWENEQERKRKKVKRYYVSKYRR